MINLSDSNYETRHLHLRNNKGCRNIKATQSRLLGVKIAQFCSSALKLCSYMRKCRLKYLEHVLHADKLATAKAQNNRRAVGSDGTKTYFLRLLNNVVTFRHRKRRKLARKCAHNTAHARVKAVCTRKLTSVLCG